jgi:hypothetical protein
MNTNNFFRPLCVQAVLKIWELCLKGNSVDVTNLGYLFHDFYLLVLFYLYLPAIPCVLLPFTRPPILLSYIQCPFYFSLTPTFFSNECHFHFFSEEGCVNLHNVPGFYQIFILCNFKNGYYKTTIISFTKKRKL